jgi:hypothetical protein
LPADNQYYILFATIHDVLKAEKLFKGSAIDAEVVPVPRKLSSDCGVCIKSSNAPETLGAVLEGMTGIRCFAFDGADYLPYNAHNGR